MSLIPRRKENSTTEAQRTQRRQKEEMHRETQNTIRSDEMKEPNPKFVLSFFSAPSVSLWFHSSLICG
jgi:hypothetical protein